MSKRVFVDQPGFLGDIIFVMAIAQKYANEGYVVDYPVFDEYIKDPSIQKYFSTINFIGVSKFPNYNKYHKTNVFEDSEYIYLPFVANFLKNQCYNHMEFKYKYLNFPLDMWRNIKIDRDYNAENRLFEKLELKEGDKYNLINENHQRTFIKVPIHVNNEYKNVYMDKIENYGMFDWIGVMERAQSIHTIGTSLIFIIDALTTIPKDLHIYRRLDKGHDSYDYLLNKKYIYH